MSGDTGPTENKILKVGTGRKNYGFVRDTVRLLFVEIYRK
jgi:hypothetical protein